MNQLKYIIVKSDRGVETPILFTEMLDHHKVVFAFKSQQIVSAGFCYLPDGLNDTSCFGKSESLGIESRPEEDGKLIDQQLFGK